LSVIGWMLTGVAWVSFRAGDGLDSLAYGIVTGLGLVWLRRGGLAGVVRREQVAESK
jgi:hypothetical protein